MAKSLCYYVTLFLSLCIRISPFPITEQNTIIYKYQKLTVVSWHVLNNQIFTFFFLQFQGSICN